MLVSLYPSLNQSKIKQKTKSTQETIPQSINYKRNNVSFGSFSWIFAVARGSLKVIKDGPKYYKMTKLLAEIKSVLDNSTYLNNLLPDTLSALAKIPDNSSNAFLFHMVSQLMGKEKWGNLFVGMPELVVKNLRLAAIRTLSLTNDDLSVNIQSKKDFIRSLFTHGYDLNDDFFKEFKKLNDDYYKSFKEEIVDTCLYSKEYASKRYNACYTWITPSPIEKNEFQIKNMSLVDSLDEKTHSDYLKKIYNTIVETKKYLLNAAIEDFRDNPISMPDVVGNDFYYFGRPINRELYNKFQYHSIIFDAQLKSCNGDISQLEKYFKMTKKSLEEAMISRKKYQEDYKINPWHTDDK